MSRRTRSASAISENSIVFFQGGHNHDGISSSLINTDQYSIYDFIVGKTGSNERQIKQQRNFDNLKTVISNIVINDVLGPSGVRLLPNSVQSVHIAAGAITANELAANIVLVNNVISSNNYVANTSGWVLYSNGSAEFGAASIRGTITAGAVNIGADDFWNSDGSFKLGGNTGIYTSNGNIVIGSSVLIDGNVQVSNVYIDNLNFWEPGIFQVGVDSDNLIAFNNNTLEVTGVVQARAGSIGDWTISGGDLVGISTANVATMTISANNGGTIQAGNLLIGNGDLNAEDVVARNIIRIGENENDAIDIIHKGIYYTESAQFFSRPNRAVSFTYDGTNVYAHFWTGSSYINVCLSNCGSGTTPVAPTPVAPTPVAPTPVAPTPVAPTPVPEPGTPIPIPDEPFPVPILPTCDPPCPEGFVCVGSNICIG